jgi:acetyl esterase/lipase
MFYRNQKILILYFILMLLTGCGGGDNNDAPLAIAAPNSILTESEQNNGVPIVNTESSYSVILEEDIIYAQGLGHDDASNVSFAQSLNLDVYYPDNSITSRPVFMFIHGGGFTGGIKHKPEIVDMANYYASRGWVFVSIDYRTTEELGSIDGKSQEDLSIFYRGIAPQEWIEYAIQGVETLKQLQQSIAMYAAQRDAKAALRWIIANSSAYNINTDFITVGGASAGAISTIALGISNQEDFRDEISITDDPTLSTTNLDENFTVKSMIYFWGSNIKLELFESIYGLNRYDSNDPELFIAHGTNDENATTPFSEATELQDIYNLLNVYNQLIPLEGQGHGAWNAEVDGKGLFEMSFDFIVERQFLQVE